MVQIDTLNLNVIKVTIKDKPGLQRQPTDENLRKVFQALRHHAVEEKEVRQIRNVIETRSSTRRLKQCFATWRNTARQKALNAKKEQNNKNVSNEEKIELLVEAIAEKQKQQQQQNEQVNEKKKAKSAPPSTSKPALNARTLSGTKAKEISTIVTKSRLQAQKRIIEEQRAKLEEQRRMIEEMRLKELDEEAKRTNKETLIMAKQALGQCTDQRTKRSILHLMREQGCRDKTLTADLVPQIPHTPTFLLRMEARAEIRKQRIKQTEEIHQRRREEEKKREETRRKEIEEQERQRQLQALKEAKKQRRELEEKRKKELERNQRLEYMADQFYKRYLFRKYALEPFGSLVEEKHNYLQTADQHYGLTLMVKIFSAWKSQYFDQREEKLQLAAKLYQRNLMWYSFDDWRNYAVDMKQKYQVAVDFCDMKLQSRFIKGWYALHCKIKEEERQRMLKAQRHHERKLKELFFGIWRQYMEIASDVNEREHRRDEWRHLIKKFIPSDTPKFKNVTLKS